MSVDSSREILGERVQQFSSDCSHTLCSDDWITEFTSPPQLGPELQPSSSSSYTLYPDDSITNSASPLLARPKPKPLSPITKDQLPERTQQLTQRTSSQPNSSSATTQQSSNKQNLTTTAIHYKFTIGMERLATLIARYSKSAPETSFHLKALRDCLATPTHPYDSRAKNVREDVDGEKAWRWKFRFLDLIIEMVVEQDERVMGKREVVDVLVYVEGVVRAMRSKMEGKGLAGESGLDFGVGGVV